MGESELKEADPIEKAEKDFWKIIDEEKRRRDKKGGAVVREVDLDEQQSNWIISI